MSVGNVLGDSRSIVTCGTCSAPQAADADFCTACGYALSQPSCRTCNTALRADYDFCAACGTPVGETPRSKPKDRNRNNVFALVGAGLGVLVVLAVVWLLTSGNGEAPEVAAPTTVTTEVVVESTLRTIPRSEPTTTTTTEPPATTTTLSVELQTYFDELSAVLSDMEAATDDIEASSSFWDLTKDTLEDGARSTLWRTTQGEFQIAIFELGEAQTAFEAIVVPEGAGTHTEVTEQFTLLRGYADSALEGLQLPRGSEEVDGTMRLEAIANMNATLGTLRDLIRG